MRAGPSTFAERGAAEVGSDKAKAVGDGARHLIEKRAVAVEAYPVMDAMRDRAREIRLHTLANLDMYLARFADAVEALGGHVFFAANATEANDYIRGIAEAAGAARIAKVKSMVTEEIELNAALEADGRVVVESDLGEFIVQLADDRPSHIVAPVLHWTRQEVGRLFADELDVPYTDVPAELNQIAATICAGSFSRRTWVSPASTSQRPQPVRSPSSQTRATADSQRLRLACTSP